MTVFEQHPNLLLALGVTLFAGLATGIGSLIAFFAKTTNKRFLAVALGFSAGVMIYVSMIEIFGKAQEALTHAMGEPLGNWLTVISFFVGMGLIALIDLFVPSYENPHEIRDYQSDPQPQMSHIKLLRMGTLMALAIGIHNFPEGLATFIATLDEPRVGIAIAIAIAIHNIPEGISVSVPIYYATGSKRKALFYSILSGIAEPVGAVVGFLVLMPFINEMVFGLLFGVVAGIMVFISLDQLLPSAREYGEHHLSIYGMVAGMMVMALSLLLLT